MRTILRLTIFLCILSSVAFGQERAASTIAGPSGETYKVLVSLNSGGADSYKLQTLTIDVNQVKAKNEKPTRFYVDMASTFRSLDTGAERQKKLVLGWEGTGDVVVKCDGGVWANATKGAELDKIVEVVKDVIAKSPLDVKSPIQLTLPKDVADKIAAILDSLETTKLNCVRGT